MSAYVVDDEVINNIISYLYTASLGNMPFSFYRLKDLGFHLSFEQDCLRLAEEMFALNVDAVEQRYGKGQAETFRPLDFKFQFTGTTKIVRAIKALSEWLYQCSEGDIDKTKLYRAMDAIRYDLYAYFARNTQEWKEEDKQ